MITLFSMKQNCIIANNNIHSTKVKKQILFLYIIIIILLLVFMKIRSSFREFGKNTSSIQRGTITRCKTK